MCPQADRISRRGLTLIEMMIATAIMGIMAATLGGLAVGVQRASRYSESRSTALQNARVALERINRLVTTAYASADHPGMWVVYETSGTYRFPDTLIIWRPETVPSSAAGPPLVKECVFICPDPSAPNKLVEITAPTDTRQIPLNDTLNSSSWRSTLASIKTASTSKKIVLTQLLKTVTIGSGATAVTKGSVRFVVELHPTSAEWTSYKAGTLTWANMGWPQGLVSPMAGIRQVQLRTELQLVIDQLAEGSTTTTAPPMPFFGSAVLCYQLTP